MAYFKRPDELAWESEPDCTLQTDGRVNLVRQGSGTLARVRLSYRRPAGGLGQAAATLLGANPKQKFEEDLHRMKQFIEGRRERNALCVSGLNAFGFSRHAAAIRQLNSACRFHEMVDG